MTGLSEPIKLGDLDLRNRIVESLTLAALLDRVSQQCAVGAADDRACGAGLILFEEVSQGREKPASGRDVTRDREVLARVQEAGGRVVRPLSWPAEAVVPPLDQIDLAGLFETYRGMASTAAAAGFNGVELDLTDGGPLMQLLSPGRNRRKDDYGGSTLRRCRPVLDVLKAVGGEIGCGRVGLRIDPQASRMRMGDPAPAVTYACLLSVLSGEGFAYVRLMNQPVRELDALMMTRAYWSGSLIVDSVGQQAKTPFILNPPGEDLALLTLDTPDGPTI